MRDVRFTPDDRHLVSLAQDHTLRVYAVDSGAEVATPLAALCAAGIALDPRGGIHAVDIDGRVVSAFV